MKPRDKMHRSEYAANHFAFNRWILKFAGLWAPENQSTLSYYAYKCYQIFVFLFVNIYFTATEFLAIFETYGDLELLIKNINFALTHMMGAFKCAFWFFKGHKLLYIIRTLENERFHYENSVGFNPGEISFKAKRTGFKYTLSFFLLAHMTLSSSYFPAVIMAIFKPIYEQDGTGNMVFNHKLPYFSWMPFSYDTPKSFLFALMYQAGPMVSYAYSIVGMDTLFMNIMNYIAAQLLIVKGAFRTIRDRSVGEFFGKTSDGNSDTIKINHEMKRCIRHLQTIIEMSEELERTYNLLTLGQIMATLFILCTSLFLVSTTSIASKQFAAESVYMIAMGFQLVLYCWFGNQVTIGALEIPQALWEGDWLEYSESLKKSMLITMIRMKRPIHFTVGKFAPLTLTTFVAILKASYSFFAVLKKVND